MPSLQSAGFYQGYGVRRDLALDLPWDPVFELKLEKSSNLWLCNLVFEFKHLRYSSIHLLGCTY